MNPGDPAFFYKDPINFFIEAGRLPENVTTAIAFAAFNYVAENALGNPYNDKETINSLLGRSEDTPIVGEETRLITAGISDKQVIARLGQTVMQALGYAPDKDAPLNDIARMEGSLGAHAMALLIQEGLLERVMVPGSVFSNAENSGCKQAASFRTLQAFLGRPCSR